MKKRLLAALLACMVLFSFAGCAAEQESTVSEGEAAPDATTDDTEADSGEIAPIQWLTTGDAGAKPIVEGDRVIAEINSRLGIDLTVDVVPEGNVERVNVVMASGDLPDVVTGQYGSSATQQWIEDDMLLPLNDYLGSNPALKDWVEVDYAWTVAEDGNFYGAPFITQYDKANALITMRGDWLDALGLEYPTTIDEFTEVLRAFTEDDPDGNGTADTYGFTATKPSGSSTPFDFVFFAFGAEYSDYQLGDDGNVKAFFEYDGFVPAMEYIKGLWDAGYIDQELMLNDTPLTEEKFYQGKAGAFAPALFRHVSRHEGNLQSLNADGFIEYGLPPAGEDGSFGLAKQGKTGMFTAVGITTEYPEKAVSFIDFMISDEGTDLLRLGIEGLHYSMDGDTIVFNEEERQVDAFADNGWAHPIAWGSLYWPLESSYLPESEPDRDRALESVELASEAQVPALIKQTTALEAEVLGSLNDIYLQAFVDMLSGTVGVQEGYDQLVEDWYSQGGTELLAELTNVYNAQQG